MNIVHNIPRFTAYSTSGCQYTYHSPVTLPGIPGVSVTSARPETTPNTPTLRTGRKAPVVGIVAFDQQRKAIDRIAAAICSARQDGVPSVTEVIGE